MSKTNFSLLLTLALSLSLHSSAQLLKKKQAANTDTAQTETTNTDDGKKAKTSVFGKVLGKVSKMAGGAIGSMGGMVATAGSLNDVDVISALGTNIYPKEIGLIFTDFLKGDYIDHGDFTMVQLASKDGYTMYKYGGTIKSNGKEVKHATMGIHTVVLAPQSGDQKFTFEKNGSEEGSFTIPAPTNQIKLLAVNGQKQNANIDLAKEVTIELANFSTTPSSLIRIDLVTTVLGIRALTLVAYAKPAAKIVIPAAAFRNLETANNYNLNNAYLSVSDQLLVMTKNTSGAFTKPFESSTGSNDGMWVTATNKPEPNKGFDLKGNGTFAGNEMEILEASKKNAAYAMPLSWAKKIAIATLNISGTTYAHETKENKLQGTRTETTIQFPEVPVEWHQQALATMYEKYTAAITEVLSSKFLPATAIPNAPSYADVARFFADDNSDYDEFSQSYKGLNPIKGLTTVSLRMKGENALLTETQADALLKIRLVMRMSTDKGGYSMNPYLYVDMDGASNGGFRSYAGNTHYFTIAIQGKPFKITNKSLKNFTKEDYQSIVQVDAFLEAFKQTLKKIKAEEERIGDYDVVWNLQK